VDRYCEEGRVYLMGRLEGIDTARLFWVNDIAEESKIKEEAVTVFHFTYLQ
jgi:hypothetical protein